MALALTITNVSGTAANQSWIADQDYTLTGGVNYGFDDMIVHLDPDQTYASWVAGLTDGLSTQFFVFMRANIPLSLNFEIPKGLLLIFSPQHTNIALLFFEPSAETQLKNLGLT
jgi:hypothetical protein